MKTFIFAVIILLLSLNSNAQNLPNETIFIKEYSPKISGEFIFIFIKITDKNPIPIHFTVYFKNKKIYSCKMTSPNYKIKFTKQNDGNIFVESINKGIYFSNDNFKIEKKAYTNDIYKLIAPNFLDITNQERYELLEDLSEKEHF
jgi:hypothetical protein